MNTEFKELGCRRTDATGGARDEIRHGTAPYRVARSPNASSNCSRCTHDAPLSGGLYAAETKACLHTSSR